MNETLVLEAYLEALCFSESEALEGNKGFSESALETVKKWIASFLSEAEDCNSLKPWRYF